MEEPPPPPPFSPNSILMEKPPPPPPFSLLTEEETLLFALEQSSSLIQTDQNEAPSLSNQTEVKKKKKKKKNKKKKKKTTQEVDSTAENEVANPAENEVANPAENEETLLFPLEQSSSLIQTDQNEAPFLSHQTEVKKKKKKKKNKKKKKKTTQGVDSTAENEVANPPSRSFPLPTARLPGTLVMKMTSKVDSIQQKAKLYSSTFTDEVRELAALFDEARIILQQEMDDIARIIKSKEITMSGAKTPNHIRNRLRAEVDSLKTKTNYILMDAITYQSMKDRIGVSPLMNQFKKNDSELFEMEGAGVSEPDYGQSSFEDALAEAKMDTILLEKLANMKFGK